MSEPGSGDDQQDVVAVVVSRAAGAWQVEPLPDAVADDLDALVDAVRAQPGEEGAFALVDVAGEFFVVVRVQQGRVRLLLSDVTAAAEWDLAEQVVEHLGLDVPEGDELDEVWPAGDLDLFGDLGLDAVELGVVLSDLDAYADEMLSAVTRRLGFVEHYERVVDALSGRERSLASRTTHEDH